MPITGLAIAAGIGLLKSQTVDKDREKRQRKLAAETQRYSPWTGLKAGPIQEADPFGSALQYGGAGAMMGAGYANSQKPNPVIGDVTNNYGSMGTGQVSGMNYSQDPYSFFGLNSSGWIK